jgi:hypothetical protein
MVTEQLIAFIKEQQSAKKTKKQITDLLLQNGWKSEDITAGFENIKTGVPVPSSQTARPAGQLLGVFELISQSWNLFTKRWQTFFGIIAFQILAGIATFILLFIGGFSALFTLGVKSDSATNETLKLGLGGVSLALLILAMAAISLFYFLSTIATYYAVRSEADPGVKQSFAYAWSKFGSFLWVSVLSTLVIGGGMLLFYIPGLIAAVGITFSIFVLMTEDVHGMDALIRSWRYVYGHWWSILWRFFAFGFWLALASGILGTITMGIASSIISIVVTPIMAAYTYLLYNNLKSLPRDPQALTRPNGHFKVFAILGIFAVIGYIGLMFYIFTHAATSSI